MASSAEFNEIYESFSYRERAMYKIWMAHFRAVARMFGNEDDDDRTRDQWSSDAIANVVANMRLPT